MVCGWHGAQVGFLLCVTGMSASVVLLCVWLTSEQVSVCLAFGWHNRRCSSFFVRNDMSVIAVFLCKCYEREK